MVSAGWIKTEKYILSESDGTFRVTVGIDWDALGSGWGEKTGTVRINSASGAVDVQVRAYETPGLPAKKNVFVESDGVISMEAEHFAAKHCEGAAGWFVIDGYGKTLSGMKVLPADSFFTPDNSSPHNAPWLEYRFVINHPGTYNITCFIAPTNDPVKGKGQKFALSVDGGGLIAVDSLPEGYAAGDPADADWCRYVLDNCRRCTVKLKLAEGEHKLRFIHMDAGIVLHKIEIAKKPSRSFYGYRETYHG